MKRIPRRSKILLSTGAALALTTGCTSDSTPESPESSESQPRPSAAAESTRTYGIGVLLGTASLLPERTNLLCTQQLVPEGDLIKCSPVQNLRPDGSETLQVVGTAILSRCMEKDGEIVPLQMTVTDSSTIHDYIDQYDAFTKAYADGKIVNTERNIGSLSCIDRLDATANFQNNVPIGTPLTVFEQ